MRHRAAIAVFVAVASLGLVGQVANHPGQTPATRRAMPLTPLQAEYGRAGEIAARVLVANGCRDTYAPQIGRAAVDNRISPRLIGGIVFVESSCNPDAVSTANAIGLMQINGRVWPHSLRDLRDPDTNTQIGTKILADYVRTYGLREGLRHYNGLGDDGTYGTKVIYAAYRR
jgi:soluble lytic murein transglycosylase-like protein